MSTTTIHRLHKTTISSYKSKCQPDPLIEGTIEEIIKFFDDSQTSGHIWMAESFDEHSAPPDDWSPEKPWIVSFRDEDYSGFKTAEEALFWHVQTSEDYILNPTPTQIGRRS